MGVEFVKDEADKKRQEIRELGTDISALHNPDPNKRYRFINKNQQRVARFKAQGYEITSKDSKTKTSVNQPSPEGGQMLGDLVLMETSMDNYKRRVQKAAERGAARERLNHEETMDRINKIARDEGRIRKPVAFDESTQT